MSPAGPEVLLAGESRNVFSVDPSAGSCQLECLLGVGFMPVLGMEFSWNTCVHVAGAEKQEGDMRRVGSFLWSRCFVRRKGHTGGTAL